MASRNKSIGRKAEKKFVARLAERLGLIPLTKDKSGSNLSEAEIGRAEEISQLLDNEGVDIWITPKSELSKFNIQIKSTLVTGKKVKSIDVSSLFEMPDKGINVVFTEMKYRPGKRNMIHLADVVTLTLDDFLTLMSVYQAYQNGNDEKGNTCNSGGSEA